MENKKNSSYIRVPYRINHLQELPDIQKVMDLIDFHSDFLIAKNAEYSYKILIGQDQVELVFYILKRNE